MTICGVFPRGWSPAVLSNSNPTHRLLQHRSRIPKFLHTFGQGTLGGRLGVTLLHSNNPRRICVCVYDAGGQRRDGRGERQREGVVAEIVDEDEEISVRKRTVAVFWDLDNKPPNLVPAYDAALRLKRLAEEFGEVVDMVAYANQNAFTFVPTRVREERQDRRMLDQLERRGVVKLESPYICRMCGRRSKTNLDLKKHFKQLHERERNKRMAYLGQLKGKKRSKFLEKMASKESKYKEAAKTVILPKVGYGLASELKRAGVAVRTVEKRPQAADEALLRHMTLYINRGIECVCLVSDDSDFLGILKLAKTKHVCTIVIGDTGTLRVAADASFSWEDVVSGRAMVTAHDKSQRWDNEDALRAELLNDDDWDDDPTFSESDPEEFEEFQRRLRSSFKISAFADDEDGYISDDEDEEEHAEEDERYGGWDSEAEEAVNSQGSI